MTTTETTQMEAPSAGSPEAFLNQAAQELAAAAGIAMALVGDRLGLYRELAAAGPLTPPALASRTGCAERYVREWLCSQAAGGWLSYESATGQFSLPAGHAAVIADEDSPMFLGGSIQSVSAIYRSLDRLCDAFRTGEGIAWGEHHRDLHEGSARFFRTACHQALPGWVERLDGIASRLRRGGRIVDLGCGQGGASICLAQAFPEAEVVGVDLHEASIERARAAATNAGVSDRVTFRVARADEIEPEAFDLVTMMDCLHDMGDPVAAAAAARAGLRHGGVVLVVEPAAGDRLEDNLHPIGRTFYASSTAFCTPGALSQEGGWALGAQAGPARIRDVCSRAGLLDVDDVEVTPFQFVLAARP